jgi:hypothetical protein
MVSVLIALLAVTGTWSAIAAASVRKPPSGAGTLVLHPVFRHAGAVAAVLADDRYAFAHAVFTANGDRFGVAVDERTGKPTALSRPGGCRPVALGGPWLALRCSNRYDLYGLSSGRWQAFAQNPSLGCVLVGAGCYQAAGVGARWVEFVGGCNDITHCSPSYVLQNIQTGRLENDPTGETTIADLNSPSLARKVCSPLSVPHADIGVEGITDLSGWGSLTFHGSFAVASGYQGTFLERCGTRLHQRLLGPRPTYDSRAIPCPRPNCPPAGNSRAIIWQSANRQLAGVLLPSLRRFVIPVPKAVDPQGDILSPGNVRYQLALSSRTLYLINEYGQLWTTGSPTPPTPKH